MHRYHNLSLEEANIIEKSKTEPARIGTFCGFENPGVYVCKKCDTPLYLSSAKFPRKIECGWPSFEETLEGSVLEQPDPDGTRTEILCAHCKGHLGHIFRGERFTKTNTRHCVNSLSLRFIPAQTKEGLCYATFAGGCFWGLEHLLKKATGVISVCSGYTGGHVTYPTYKEVCTGKTGHLEAVQLTYNPKLISYEELVKYFFEIHCPFQKGGQGPDIGPQYLSAIFYYILEQKTIAHSVKQILSKGFNLPTTQIYPATYFYPAENEHQNYYGKHHKEPYCHIYKQKF